MHQTALNRFYNETKQDEKTVKKQEPGKYPHITRCRIHGGPKINECLHVQFILQST